MSHPSTIAIDGPAASGKSTLAQQLAKHLGYVFFDTGLMYRAVTLAALDKGIDLSNQAAVVALAEALQIDVLPGSNDHLLTTVLINRQNVTHKLRTARIDASVSIPSSYPGVRDAVNSKLRQIGRRGRIVMVGRDIGTVVLPDADLKIYLDASVEERARRRWHECQELGRTDTYEEILASMRKRDSLDTGRLVAPLRPASDAHVIHTNDLRQDQVWEAILSLINNHAGHQSSDEIHANQEGK
jgi:cytidylate kinase